MSLDASRTHIIPVETLPAVFGALAEIAARRRDRREVEVILPGGEAVRLACDGDGPFQPDEPCDLAREGEDLTVDFPFRVAFDRDIEEYLEQDPEPPFEVVRSRTGARRAIFMVSLSVSIEHPYATVTFANVTSRDVTTFVLDSPCDVMDHVGRCADRIATYRSEMGQDRFAWPVEGPFPEHLRRREGPGEMAAIVEHVRTVVEAAGEG